MQRVVKNPSLSQIAMETRRRALMSGDLPHEILLNIARGEPMKMRGYNEEGDIVEWDHFPTVDERIGAAVSAAPYFAPKLAMQQVDVSARRFDPSQLSDEELNRYLSELEPIVVQGEVVEAEMQVLEDNNGQQGGTEGSEGGLSALAARARAKDTPAEDTDHVSRRRTAKARALR